MTQTKTDHCAGASFRDPCGFVFFRDGRLLRQINRPYKENYELGNNSGLYESLINRGDLIAHEEVDEQPFSDTEEAAISIIKPDPIPFISYPYEWCFSQLKDAALLTLTIQERAFEHGMILKDASAYNIQFMNGKPIFIDTLSFERYTQGEPWVAYRQFCQHFLAPLALMSRCDVRCGLLSKTFLDGVPLDFAAKSLPFLACLKPSLFMHVYLHAKSQKKYSTAQPGSRRRGISRTGFSAIVASLKSAVESLRWKPGGTEWADYYHATNYADSAFEHKKKLLREYLEQKKKVNVAWDIGANSGVFSRIIAERNITTVAFDMDPSAVEYNYTQCKEKQETNLLPLVQDITNPSPAIGWANAERDGLSDRQRPDLVLALALIHHLVISNNLPLSRIAAYFSSLTSSLIIEFVPKEDSQVKRMLESRKDVFPNYNQESFEQAFSKHFDIERKDAIVGTERTLYFMDRRSCGS